VNRPTKIGKYEVIDVIGRGGMGVVYKATDPHLGRPVAIKMMTGGYAAEPDLLKRFYREAQSTASLQHANIVTVYDLGDQDGNPYMVMEYLEGESLDAAISFRRELSDPEKIQFILEACRGLSYAHERGIVHRDIKPANIMLSKNGGVKLVDFGIAHIASKTLTRTGQIMGSINYMSPEQINGLSVDARSDIFSTGVVLYQLFTYALPFEGESAAATLLKIIHDPPPPLGHFLSTYPKELESIILRALAKNREDRYPSADEFALDLVQVHEQLKQDMVERHLREAEALLEKLELNRARDHLLQLLKLDQKHTQAINILRQVQQRIEKEQSGEQARQLRTKAEESYAQGQFEAALHYLDQAVALDRFNPELPKFREVVREAKAKAEDLQGALRRAEAAHDRGDLEAARQAADEALGISADNTEAKALYRIIHRDWVEQSRQRQLASLLGSARKEISARNLTAALNILKQAESLDPQGAQVHALMEEVLASRELERRRKELERINRETEEALSRDDYEAASIVLAEGLRQFPQDRGLIQLKALTERQRAAAEKKLFVRQQIANVRQSLEAGRTAEALAGLQSALQKVPQEPQLEALLAIVKERVAREEQEERRRELERINREIELAVNRKDYETASAKVAEGLRRFPQERSLIHLKQSVEKQYVAAQREAFVSQQMAGARRLLDANQAVEALALLQAALLKAPQEPQLETLLSVVQERVARDEAEQAKSRSVQQAREAIGRHAFREAIRILEAAQLRFVDAVEIDNLLRFAREQERKETKRRTVEEASQRAQQWIAESHYERAVQLLESTLSQVPDDQLRVLLEETRRRRDDYQRDFQSAIAKARQFLRDGMADKAVEFLAAQPESCSRSPEFGALLETARKQQVVESVERQLAGEPDLDRQAQILESAQKKYPAHANWQQRLQLVREQRKIIAREQEQQEKERRTVEEASRRAQQWIAEYQYERAVQLLETTLSQVSDDQLRVVLEETRRRRDDHQRDLQAAIAKAQQFLRDGTADKAVEFLAAQPEFYSRSAEFVALLEAARKQLVVEAVERQLASESDLDRQVQILENAQKKYPAHAKWQQRLQPIREQRKLVACEQERKEKERRTVEEASRRARQWIGECEYERAVQLLETALFQVPDDQLRVLVDEARRRRDDYQRDLQAAMATAQKFLRDGTTDEAVEFLAAQPEFYSRSPEFGALLESARKRQVVESVERQLAGEPDLDRQVQILESAQKKYAAHANWPQRLQSVRDQRKQVLSIVQQARKFERSKKYDKALHEWERLQSVYGRYPGLPQEVDRLARLDEEARVRAIAAAQEKAVGRKQSVGVVTPPPTVPMWVDHESGSEPFPEREIGLEEHRPAPPFLVSTPSALRKPAVLALLGLVLVAGVSVPMYMHFHKPGTVVDNSKRQRELDLQGESRDFRKRGRLDDALARDQEIAQDSGPLSEWAKTDAASIEKLKQQENSLMTDAEAADDKKEYKQAEKLYQQVMDLHGGREADAKEAKESVLLREKGGSPEMVAQAFFDRGADAFKRRDYPAAEKFFQDALKQAPQSWGSQARAQEYVKRSATILNQQSSLRDAESQFSAKQYGPARSAALEAANLQDGDPDVQQKAKALIQRIQGREEQKKMLDSAMRLESSGAKDEAREQFDRAAKAPNGDPDLSKIATDHYAKLSTTPPPPPPPQPPLNYDSQMTKAGNFVNQGQWDQADTILNAVPSAQPGYTDLKRKIAEGRQEDKDFSDKKNAVNEALRNRNQNTENTLKDFRNYFSPIATQGGRHSGDASDIVASIDSATKEIEAAKSTGAGSDSGSGGGVVAANDDPNLIRGVVDSFAEAMTEGNIEKVKIARRLTPDVEKTFVESLKILKQQKGYRMAVQSCTAPQISSDNAKITCRVLTEASAIKPRTDSFTYSLQRINGRWIIISSN
jgi:serine/threonine protein kinase